MAPEASVRRLLPQSSQMSSFSFAAALQQQPGEAQRNYVFVDEQNRHKRLKVMRACEGCRRRKIKCDAATTNKWPCSGCVRLKLKCSRPNGYEGASEPQIYDTLPGPYEPAAVPDGFRQQLPLHDQYIGSAAKPGAMYAPPSTYTETTQLYHGVHYSEPFAAISPLGNTTEQRYPLQGSFPAPSFPHSAQPISLPESFSHSAQPISPPESFHQDQHSSQLADIFGSLQVNDVGTAPYLNNRLMRPRTRDGEEEPAVEEVDEYKSLLPPLTARPGSKIRIPPELMPEDATAMHYFDLYFENAHPYVPVLDRQQFYRQWQSNRESMSPLLLEAIFAIAGRLADDPGQGEQWVALATRHADSFMDIPRLSTLQALMIIMKAREQAPKRGYYYRSWMGIVQCVQMGKDLGLDEHHYEHQSGRPCGSAPAECQLLTRIWQCIFVVEVMVGSPQARTDLAVEIDSVDFGVQQPTPGGGESEYNVSRNFTYLARVVRNIGRMNKAYARIRRRKDWGVDPEFVEIEPRLKAWLAELPTDLAVSFLNNGSPPWLPSPFIGNLHSYYHLSIILFHRPQLRIFELGGADGQWKHHMLVSYSAAKNLCRLQEAVLQSFGLPGLQCMQRGINFTIYAVLACLVLDLVAVTSPDPDLNVDARDFFERHMRILEQCMGAWPMPDMQRQVDSVREAFSADTRRPFVLKPSFPYGTPQSTTPSSPLRPPYCGSKATTRAASVDHDHMDPRSVQHSQVNYAGNCMTPPFSTGSVDSRSESPAGLQTLPLSFALAWNPSRIFEQWNTSFGTPSATQAPRRGPFGSGPPSARSNKILSIASSPGAVEVPTLQDIQTVHAQLPPSLQQIHYSPPPIQTTFVTPAMWRESVASVYQSAGLKRAWEQ